MFAKMCVFNLRVDLKTEQRHQETLPEKFLGIEGKVIQAQGLHVAHIAQVYCRIKLHRYALIHF
jgi:hypothetical protein